MKQKEEVKPPPDDELPLHPPEPEPEAPNDHSEWHCASCTMLNQPGVHVCNMCGCPRSGAPPSMRMVVDDIDNAEWQCMMCASVNPPDRDNCGACTYSKEKSVASLREQQMMAQALAISKQSAEVMAQLAAQEEALISAQIAEQEQQSAADNPPESQQQAPEDTAAEDPPAEDPPAEDDNAAEVVPVQDESGNAEEVDPDAKPEDADAEQQGQAAVADEQKEQKEEKEQKEKAEDAVAADGVENGDNVESQNNADPKDEVDANAEIDNTVTEEEEEEDENDPDLLMALKMSMEDDVDNAEEQAPVVPQNDAAPEDAQPEQESKEQNESIDAEEQQVVEEKKEDSQAIGSQPAAPDGDDVKNEEPKPEDAPAEEANIEVVAPEVSAPIDKSDEAKPGDAKPDEDADPEQDGKPKEDAKPEDVKPEDTEPEQKEEQESKAKDQDDANDTQQSVEKPESAEPKENLQDPQPSEDKAVESPNESGDKDDAAKTEVKSSGDEEAEKAKSRDTGTVKVENVVPAAIPKPPKKEEAQPIRLDTFDIELGMEFSMGIEPNNTVHYEVDMHFRTKTDDYVKCSQPKSKMNKEYPKKIFLDKEQLRFVKSKHMDRLREEQKVSKKMKRKLRQQKVEKAPENVKGYLNLYDDGTTIEEIADQMKSDKVELKEILPFIDDEDALRVKMKADAAKKRKEEEAKRMVKRLKEQSEKLARKRMEIEQKKIERKFRRDKRINAKKEKISLLRDMKTQQRGDLAEAAYEKRLSFLVDDEYANDPRNPLKIEGDSRCSIEAVDKGWKCTARSNFPSIRFKRGVKGGRWYYEVILNTSKLKQIGFMTKESKVGGTSGVGDDAHSWAYDGHRRCLWHKKEIKWDTPRWKEGDVVGIALDCYRKEIKIYLNGQDLGVAFKNVKCKKGIFPAMSLQNNDKATFVFDINHFAHEIPSGYAPFIGDDPKIGNQLRARFTAMTIRSTINDAGYYIVLPKGDYAKSCELAKNFSRFGIAVSILPRQHLGALTNRTDPKRSGYDELGGRERYNADIEDLKQHSAIHDPINSNLSLTASANVARSIVSELVSFLRWMLKDEASARDATLSSVPSNKSLRGDDDPTMTGPSIPRHPSGIQRSMSTISIQENIVSTCVEGEHHDEWREITLQTLANILENPSSPKDLNSFTGALCILGGLNEPLRVGGIVKMNSDNFGHNNRGVIVDAPRFGNRVHVLLQKKKDQYVKQTHTTRVESTEVTPVSEFVPSFNVFMRNDNIFDTLMHIVQTDSTDALDLEDTSLLKEHPWLRILPKRKNARKREDDSNMTTASTLTVTRSPSTSPPPSKSRKTPQYLDPKTILSELRFRAISVVEALLSWESVAELKIVEPAVRFMIEFTLKNNEKRRKLSSGNVENTKWQALLLRDRLWEINNRKLPYFVQTPLAPMQTLEKGQISDPPSDPKEMVFSSSPYYAEKAEKVENNKMLKYWEKNIIPKIQDYVRGSFKDYEYAEFFMQLRQPLWVQEEAKAIAIAWVICANRIPDTVAFPDPDTDWTTLMYEECFAGQFVYVTTLAKANESFEPMSMSKVVNKVGRVRALDPVKEMVLVQFYDELHCQLNAYWFDPTCLKDAKPYYLSHFNGWLERYLSLTDCREELIEVENRVVILVMQRALFTLCCQDDNPLPRLKPLLLELQKLEAANPVKSTSVNAKGSNAISYDERSTDSMSSDMHTIDKSVTDDPIDFVLSALKQAINLTAMDRLGEPLNIEFADKVKRLHENLVDYAHREKITHKNLAELLMQRLEIRLKSAVNFYRKHIELRGTRECDSKLRTHSKTISVPGACALIIIFDAEAELPGSKNQPNVLTIYNDETCRSVFKTYSGGQAGKVSLLPAIVPSFECWVKLQYTDPPTPDIKFKVLPVHPDTGLSFWIVSYLLQSIEYRINSDKADATAVPDSIEICLRLMDLLYYKWDLSQMQASPLKQAVLGLCFNILSTIYFLLKQFTASGRSSPRKIQGQINESMEHLTKMQDELNLLFEQEVSGDVTSYFQLLIDFTVLADTLRSPDQKAIKDFHFKEGGKEEDEDEKDDAAEAIWNCGVCTFENPFSTQTCGICGSPMPPQKPKGQGMAKGASADKLISQFLGLTTAVSYLNSAEATSSEWNKKAVEALYQRAWDSLRAAVDPTKSWFFVQNVPPGKDEDVKRILIEKIGGIEDEVRLTVTDIYIGEDSVNGVRPTTQRRKRQRKEYVQSGAANELDTNGILYNIATADGRVEYKNPHELGLIKVTAKSIQPDSRPAHFACGREAVRCVSKREPNCWFAFDLLNRSVCPTRYQIRHYSSWETEALQNWRFEGSNDGNNWVTITNHKDDRTLQAKGQIATFNIPDDAEKLYFSKFRI